MTDVIIEKPNLRYEGKRLKVGDEIKMEERIAREWNKAGMVRIVSAGSGKIRKAKKKDLEKTIEEKTQRLNENDQEE